MRRSIVFVVLTMLLSACAAGQQPRAAATPRADAAEVYHEFAQCVRDHGQPDFPDPTIDADGRPTFPEAAQVAIPDQVFATCKSILSRITSSKAGHPDPQQMLRFARCMRQQGIDDWPDPDDQGRFHFPPSLAGSGNLKHGPRSARILAAANGPCKRYNPTGSIEAVP